MSQRFPAHVVATVMLAAVAALVLPGAAASAAPAQDAHPGPLQPIEPPEPPATLPKVQRGDKTQNLDRLFEALKVAPDDESAKYVENRIWAIWLASPSDTANLLMGRAKTAADAKDYDLAI